MRHVPTALLTVFAATLVAAAPPEVPKTLTAKPGQLVRLAVKTDAEIGLLRTFTDEEAFFAELLSPKGQRQFVFQAPDDAADGKQFVVGWWAKGETDGVSTVITVSAAGKKADPKPSPADDKKPPKPDDKADKKATSVRLAVVSESSVLTTEKAKFLQDKDLLALFAERKWDGPWWIDPDVIDPATGTTPAKWKAYVDRAKVLGLPSLFVVDRETGTVLYEGKPPATPAELVTILKAKTEAK